MLEENVRNIVQRVKEIVASATVHMKETPFSVISVKHEEDMHGFLAEEVAGRRHENDDAPRS